MTDHIMTMAEADKALTAEGQMFEMADAEIRGVTYRIWKHAPGSLKTILDLSLRHAANDFLVYEGERTTFAQHYAQAATLGHRLVELGVSQGDRVAIAARNLPEWVVAFWGSVVSGAITVPLNAWWTGEELAYDYRLQIDGRLTKAEERAYTCRCGAPRCRGRAAACRRGGRAARRASRPRPASGRRARSAWLANPGLSSTY